MRRLLLATLFVSAAAIAYELLLMRTLSIVQWHHFAYMIISVALLGYGASGTFIALVRRPLEARFETAFAASALLFSVAAIVCFAIGQLIPFNALEIVWNPGQFGWLCALYLVYFVPFFFAATCVGLALTCRPDSTARIYFADLFGAGLGAALIIAVLFILQPQQSVLFVLILPFVASIVVAPPTRAHRVLGAAQAGWLLVLLLGSPHTWLELHISEYKPMSQVLRVVNTRVLETRSSPLGLVTVVASPTVPFRHAPGLSMATRHIPSEQIAVFTDGDGMSALTRFDGRMDSVAYLADLPAALPYALADQPDVLLLGTGAGSDVLSALYHDAKSIDAIELNPQITQLVAKTYADFAGQIYDDPRVNLYADEARGFAVRSRRQYDLVQIGLLDSFGASGTGVQSLNESYVYTIEALIDYLERTRPGGLVAITRWLKLPPRDSLKIAATAIEALRRMGVESPGAHLAVMRSWATSTLLIRNGKFTEDEIAALRSFARTRSFDMAWYPGMPREEANRFNVLDSPWLYDGISELLGDDAASFSQRYKFNIDPATDDRPYFYRFFKWRTLPEVLSLSRTGGAGLIEWGYLVLVATLFQAGIIGLLMIVAPLLFSKRTWPRSVSNRMGAYFLLLGFAFMFIEIAFIQKFILFLSHPLYAVAVILSGFLVFAGIGSSLSEVLRRQLRGYGIAPATVAVTAIGTLALAYVGVLPILFEQLAGPGDIGRIALSLALIAPLAVAMGMPFPLGLASLADTAPGFVPWAWGLNGLASVAGAVLATLLAIEAGFRVVVVVAVLLYIVAARLLASTTAR
jgi:hypothetical protein